MRTMLSGANFSSDYWCHAINHAVYIKNRLPHSALPGHITPFQIYISRGLESSHIRVFGSHATVKQPRICRTKRDKDYTTSGIFLEFTATNGIIWFENAVTGELKNARHAIFAEAHYSADNRPPYARNLMGIAKEHLSNPTISTKPPSIPLILIPVNATPDQSSPCPLNPPMQSTTPTLIPRDDDASNDDNNPPPLVNHQIARLRVKLSHDPSISTPGTMPHIIPDDDRDEASSDHINTIADNFHLNLNPFGPSTIITLPVNSTYQSLGLDLIQHEDNDRILLQSCVPSTPTARIPRWRSTLRHSLVIAIDNAPISSIHDIHEHIVKARSRNSKSVVVTLVPTERINSTPDFSIPQIHFDQMNIMAHQHHAAKHGTPPRSDPHSATSITDASIFVAINRGKIKLGLTRAFLKR